MTKDIERRLSQTSAALALVEYWRNEAEHQRTRAEAAKQSFAAVAEACGADHGACSAARLSIYAGKLQDKLAAIRAHLAGLDVVDLDIAVDESTRPLSAFCRPIRHLLAAAREALEP